MINSAVENTAGHRSSISGLSNSPKALLLILKQNNKISSSLRMCEIEKIYFIYLESIE